MGTQDILIADNQFLITEALKHLLGEKYPQYKIRLAHTMNDVKGAFDVYDIHLLITDFNLFDFDSINDLSFIKNNHHNTNILILTNTIDKGILGEFTRIGIKNILLKTTDATDLFTAVDATLKGKKYYSAEIIDELMELGNRNVLIEKNNLTATEKEIVRLIADGLTTKQIADRKCTSFHTVNTHRKNIFRKMNVSNTSELIMHSIKAGLIDSIEYYI